MNDRFTEAAEKNLRVMYAFACEQFIEGYESAVQQAGGPPPKASTPAPAPAPEATPAGEGDANGEANRI